MPPIVLALLLVWGLFSLIPAGMAQERGRSFGAWYLVSLALSPLLAGILVAMLGDPRVAERRHRELLDAMERRDA